MTETPGPFRNIAEDHRRHDASRGTPVFRIYLDLAEEIPVQKKPSCPIHHILDIMPVADPRHIRVVLAIFYLRRKSKKPGLNHAIYFHFSRCFVRIPQFFGLPKKRARWEIAQIWPRLSK